MPKLARFSKSRAQLIAGLHAFLARKAKPAGICPLVLINLVKFWRQTGKNYKIGPEKLARKTAYSKINRFKSSISRASFWSLELISSILRTACKTVV